MTVPEFVEFYTGSRDGSLRAVAASVGDPAVAEDLVAEAYARAFARWRQLARHPAPAAWVVRTALNLQVSRWRRARREISTDLSTRIEQTPTDSESTGLEPQLAIAIRQLPNRQREVLTLRLLLDLDTATTARVLGISAGAVTAHLHRATTTLRAHLTPQPQENQS